MDISRSFRALFVGACIGFLASGPAWAADEDEPTASEMTADLLVARPGGIIVTTLGAAAFLVSLPFTAAGGNVGKAAEQLVVKPARATFVRCLGCTSSGRYQDPDE